MWRRRGLVLLVSALVWVPALVFAGNLVSVSSSSERAADRYAHSKYGMAVRIFEELDGAGPFERWRARFNQGTALVARGAEGDPLLAIEQLDEALDLAPDDARCTVQQNRAIAYELAGDADMALSQEIASWLPELREAGTTEDGTLDDPGLGDYTLEEIEGEVRARAASAMSYYEDGLEARTDPACPPPTPEQQQAQDRLEDKLEQAEAASGLDQPDGGDGPQTPEEREDELTGRNQDAEADADADRQEDASTEQGGPIGDGPGRGW